MRLATVALCSVLFACASSGCAPTRGARENVPIRSDVTERAASAVQTRTEYGTDPTADPFRGGPLAEDLAGKVRAHFSKLELVGDGRMADISTRVAAETQRLGKAPDAAGIDAIARDAGFVGPAPSVFVTTRSGDSWDHLDEFLELTPDNIQYSRIGVVVLDLGGAVLAALALGASNVALEPVKRRVEPSERISIRGTLARGYAKAEVAWTRPDGSTTRARAGDTAITFETPALERGIHRIEILGVGPSGLEVLANMPVACGVDFAPPERRIEPVDESDPKAAMFALVNRERRQAGAKALGADPALEEVAEGHSKDMVDARFFGHQSPTTGVVEDRLRAHGMRLGLFGENVAKGPSMAEAHAMLLASPAHRQNIMNRRFTHLGIGVVRERAEDPPVFAVTEVFAGFPARIENSGAAEQATLSALNRSRAEAKSPPVSPAPALRAAAGDIANLTAASATVSPGEVAGPIIKRRLAGSHYRRPIVLAGFSLDPAELAKDDRLKAPRLRAAGVAIVQSPPNGEPKTNVVVFVVSE